MTVLKRVKRVALSSQSDRAPETSVNFFRQELDKKANELKPIKQFHFEIALGWHMRAQRAKAESKYLEDEKPFWDHLGASEADRKAKELAYVSELYNVAFQHYQKEKERTESISELIIALGDKIQDLRMAEVRSVDNSIFMVHGANLREIQLLLNSAEAYLELKNDTKKELV